MFAPWTWTHGRMAGAHSGKGPARAQFSCSQREALLKMLALLWHGPLPDPHEIVTWNSPGICKCVYLCVYACMRVHILQLARPHRWHCSQSWTSLGPLKYWNEPPGLLSIRQPPGPPGEVTRRAFQLDSFCQWLWCACTRAGMDAVHTCRRARRHCIWIHWAWIQVHTCRRVRRHCTWACRASMCMTGASLRDSSALRRSLMPRLPWPSRAPPAHVAGARSMEGCGGAHGGRAKAPAWLITVGLWIFARVCKYGCGCVPPGWSGRIGAFREGWSPIKRWWHFTRGGGSHERLHTLLVLGRAHIHVDAKVACQWVVAPIALLRGAGALVLCLALGDILLGALLHT